MAAAPLVWINGFPGTGKYPIANQPVSLVGNEKAIIIDNHQLIDPVEEKMARKHPEYQNVRHHPDCQKRRREKRFAVFEQYVEDASMLSMTIIFTGKHSLQRPVAAVLIKRTVLNNMADVQSHNEMGQKVATEYIDAARRSGRPFVPHQLNV